MPEKNLLVSLHPPLEFFSGIQFQKKIEQGSPLLV
jgi:hypothetical protein